MFFLNLTLGQFLLLFGSISAISLVLYLLDRSRRRQVVSTLRFWVAAEKPTAVVRRKRVQQPLSLLLQLLSMLLLLLAIAQLRLGVQGGKPRDHVLILDTSAWMDARAGKTTLMDTARKRALAYLKSLPAGDRVMLVRADALATPATPFESNRKVVANAIARSEPGSTALNLDQALEFARIVQNMGGRRAGEIAYVGTGRISEHQAEYVGEGVSLPNLRVLAVNDEVQDCGIRKMGLRRSSADPGVWDIYVSARNYGSAPRQVTLALAFGGAPVGVRRLTLPAGAEREAAFTHRTHAAGLLEARLIPGDAFPGDDRAVLEIPALAALNVTVYSNTPSLLRPFLESNPRVSAVFRGVGQYTPDDGGLVILDRFRPATRPKADTIWIDPPASESPVPVKMRVKNPESIRWAADDPLGAGLRTRDVRLDAASVFAALPGDIHVAETENGPIILARPGNPKMVLFGFHPALTAMRYELATPLLFANVLRWIAPDTYRTLDLAVRSAGTVSVPLDATVPPGDVKVLQADGTPIPFTLRDRSLHFFSGTRGTARVIAGDRESVYSLTLPEMWETKWIPPATARRGIPTFRDRMQGSRDVWELLAILGAVGLLAEWILFGRLRRGRLFALKPKQRAAA
ncbi:MAG: VWA domain-containing protein [Acidobacteriota bacterium]|nr:VWA domain-containing protein [Acidobacteriota bacterium]